MAIIPIRSLPLFAFANDGSIAWLRAAGSKVMAVDARTGRVLREIHLDPAPFGITWSIERVGRFFVVKDDREIAAYDAEAGTRLWKRKGPTRVAFVGEKGERFVTIAPGPAGVEVLEADLATGDLTTRVAVEGSMRYVGAHGTMTGDLLVFATDERDVYAVDTARWEVVARHAFSASYVLPPVATPAGVHVAIVEKRGAGAVTSVATLDPTTGALVSTHELPGRAHAMTAGASVVVLDVERALAGIVERVAFRPNAPYVRLSFTKNVQVNVGSAGRLAPPARTPSLEILPARAELLPPPPTDEDERPESTRSGLLALLDLLGASSEVLARIANVFGERPSDSLRMHDVGLRFRDPRVRWSSRPGRDPCLLDLAMHASGDAIATYWYPAAPSSKLAVVRVDATSGEARWLADDFDEWLAGHLHALRAMAPDSVGVVLEVLDLPSDFPRPLPSPTPPSWFFEAHAARWTMLDADDAERAGDRLGAERMLVSLARTARVGDVKPKLAAIYDALGWGHHRAVVVETW